MLFSGRRRIREVAKGYGFQHFLTVEGKVTACGALPPPPSPLLVAQHAPCGIVSLLAMRCC